MAKRSAGDAVQRAGKSEIVTIRLEPKLRYLAEIAARKHRRSLSSYVEWAIDQSFKLTILGHMETEDFRAEPMSVADEAPNLWDVDEPDRFVKLALRYPDLLTHDEQVIWKLMRENGSIWNGQYHRVTGEWTWVPSEGSLNRERLRESWDKFRAVAKGAADKSTLPSWNKLQPRVEKRDGKPQVAEADFTADPHEETPF